MTETRIGNTFSKFTSIHRPWRKLRDGICRYKTFCMRIFARRTFLRFRYCGIHVKMHVLLTYSAVKRRVSMGSRNLVPAVSPMSGSPTFDTEKTEKSSEANLLFRHALRAGIVKNHLSLCLPLILYIVVVVRRIILKTLPVFSFVRFCYFKMQQISEI